MTSNKNDFNAILDCREPDALLFNDSIKLLSRCLMQYYGKKSIMLSRKGAPPDRRARLCRGGSGAGIYEYNKIRHSLQRKAMLRSHRMRHGLPRCVFTLRQPRVFYLCSLYMIWHRRRSLSSRPSPSPVPIIMPFSTHQLTASCAHRGMLSSI